jgi:hypothetical protein
VELGLLSDEALGEPGGRSGDGLGFSVYARVLADGILNASGPLTVGVFGEWGSGKTSLMRLIAREIGEHKKVIPVWFNAWRYEQDEHPMVPLVGTIVRDLKRYEEQGGQLAVTARALIRALKAVAYGFSMSSKVKVPGIADFEVSLSGKDVIERSRELQEDALLSGSLFHEAFEALESVSFADDLQIVVFIDDLDRCFPDRAVKLLESIKLVLSQRGFVFVLGVAKEVVEGYLQHRYASEYGIAEYKAHLYLDKLVQVAFTIPPSEGRMARFSEVILQDRPAQMRAQLSAVLPIVGKALGGNPRSVIRFLNNLLVDLAISSELIDGAEGPQIPIQFFAISRCLQQRWPEIFVDLLSSDDLAHEVAGWDRARMRQAVAAEEKGATVASSLLSDRVLEDLMTSPEGMGWLESAALRHASVDFLRAQSRLPVGNASTSAYDVALCYDWQDRSDVSLVAEVLADYGIRVMMQHQKASANDGSERAWPANGSVRSVLVCIGASAEVTPEQREELEELKAACLHLQGIRPRVIPVLLPGSTPDSIPGDLRTAAALDIRGGAHVEALRPVVEALRAAR